MCDVGIYDCFTHFNHTLLSCYTGIAASFAVKLFKAWIAEKDANAVTSALRKASLDKKLLVCLFV